MKTRSMFSLPSDKAEKEWNVCWTEKTAWETNTVCLEQLINWVIFICLKTLQESQTWGLLHGSVWWLVDNKPGKIGSNRSSLIWDSRLECLRKTTKISVKIVGLWVGIWLRVIRIRNYQFSPYYSEFRLKQHCVSDNRQNIGC